jgi:hypothetical protein
LKIIAEKDTNLWLNLKTMDFLAVIMIIRLQKVVQFYNRRDRCVVSHPVRTDANPSHRRKHTLKKSLEKVFIIFFKFFRFCFKFFDKKIIKFINI